MHHTSNKPGFEGFSIEITDSFEYMGKETVSFLLFKSGKTICSVYGNVEFDNRNWKVNSFEPIELLTPDGMGPHELTVMTTPELIDFICSIPDAFCEFVETEEWDAMKEQGHPSNFL